MKTECLHTVKQKPKCVIYNRKENNQMKDLSVRSITDNLYIVVKFDKNLYIVLVKMTGICSQKVYIISYSKLLQKRKKCVKITKLDVR